MLTNNNTVRPNNIVYGTSKSNIIMIICPHIIIWHDTDLILRLHFISFLLF